MPLIFDMTFLGTDTKEQPYKEADHNGPKRGDTLSHHHSLLAGVGRQFHYLSSETKKNEFKEWINTDGIRVDDKPEGELTHCLLEGPTTLATDVYDRIAKGVIEALNGVMRGVDTINMRGHSRGAVEAILVAHELDRIQQAILSSKKDLSYDDILTLITESDCEVFHLVGSYAKNSLTRCLSDFKEGGFAIEVAGQGSQSEEAQKKALAQKFKTNSRRLRVNIFALDPVPGGKVRGFNIATWEDSRFYKLSGIVDTYQQWFMRNERSCGFEAIIPTKHANTDSYEIVAMPGHHSTAAGTAHGQDKKSLTYIAKYLKRGELLDRQGKLRAGLTTEHVQTLLVYALHDFSCKTGSTFLPKRPTESNDTFDLALDELFFSYNAMSLAEKKTCHYETYQAISANRDVCEMFNQWSYFFVGNDAVITGQPRAVRIAANTLERRVDLFSELTPDFVNGQHLSLYLDKRLGVDSKLSEFISSSLSNADETETLKNIIQPSSRPSTPLQEGSDGVQADSVDGSSRDLLKKVMLSRLLSTMSDFLIKGQNSEAFEELKNILKYLPIPLDTSTELDGESKPVSQALDDETSMSGSFDGSLALPGEDVAGKAESKRVEGDACADQDGANSMLDSSFLDVGDWNIEDKEQEKKANDDTVRQFYVELRGVFRDSLEHFFEERYLEAKEKSETFVTILHMLDNLNDEDNALLFFRFVETSASIEQLRKNFDVLFDMLKTPEISQESKESVANFRRKFRSLETQVNGPYQYLLTQGQISLPTDEGLEGKAKVLHSKMLDVLQPESNQEAEQSAENRTNELQAQHRSELEAQTAIYSHSLKEHENDLNEQREMTITLQNQLMASDDNNKALSAQIAELKTVLLGAESELKQLQDSHAEDVNGQQELRDELQQKLFNTELDHQTSLSDLSDLHELLRRAQGRITILCEENRMLNDTIADLEGKRIAENTDSTKLKTEIETLRQALAGAEGIDQARLESAPAIESVQVVDNQAGMDSLREQHARELEALRAQHVIDLAAQASAHSDGVQRPSILPNEQERGADFFAGLSFQVLGGFAAALGISVVALALAALVTGALTATIPVGVAVVGGGVLATVGFFAFERGCELKGNNTPTPPLEPITPMRM